jgi:GT2 family glycosyltransferase
VARGALRNTVEREIRLPGGRRARATVALPHLTVLVHGAGAQLAARRARELAPGAVARAVDDAAAALRAEMRVRGDRYVLVAEASHLPDAAALGALVAALESAAFVALSAPDAAALNGDCVLVALARVPQHVEAAGATLADALASLVASVCALRRAVRAPGFAHDTIPAARKRSATILVAAASAPEVQRLTLTAVVESSRAGDEVIAVCAASAATTQRIVASFPQVRLETDAVDPLLAAALNRAIGAARGELIVVLGDDVLLPHGTLDRMRDAFVRVPSLGAAFPAVPGAPGGENALDAQYADVNAMRALAEQRAQQRARELEPVDLAVTPAFAVAREAFEAVGGIDPGYGPTRRGIADLVLRLRAAGYGVVRCDDALVHRFDPALSRNPAATADLRQPVPAADPAAVARGFDPARRVPFVAAGPARPAPGATAGGFDAPVHAIALPVADTAELERAAVFLAAAARVFDARSPVRVHLLLEGALSPAEAVARVRPVLAASGKAMDDTLAVRVERAADLAAWQRGLEPGVRVVVAAGHARAALAGLRVVETRELAELLLPVAR